MIRISLALIILASPLSAQNLLLDARNLEHKNAEVKPNGIQIYAQDSELIVNSQYLQYIVHVKAVNSSDGSQGTNALPLLGYGSLTGISVDNHRWYTFPDTAGLLDGNFKLLNDVYTPFGYDRNVTVDSIRFEFIPTEYDTIYNDPGNPFWLEWKANSESDMLLYRIDAFGNRHEVMHPDTVWRPNAVPEGGPWRFGIVAVDTALNQSEPTYTPSYWFLNMQDKPRDTTPPAKVWEFVLKVPEAFPDSVAVSVEREAQEK